ncbi:hypothetical protein SprV_0401634200 [Sparganum proliferum]
MDPLSLVAEHCENSGHTFAFLNAEILSRGDERMTREIAEAWHIGTTSVNRRVAIPEAYQALRTRLREQRNKRKSRQNGKPNTAESMGMLTQLYCNPDLKKVRSLPQPRHPIIRQMRKRTFTVTQTDPTKESFSPPLVRQILWTFSIYLESVAILPQLFLISKTGEAETITSHYLFALGSYRALYILNWIYRFFVESFFDPISVIAGIIQTLLYLDFFYLYITRVLKGRSLSLPA